MFTFPETDLDAIRFGRIDRCVLEDSDCVCVSVCVCACVRVWCARACINPTLDIF